MCKLCVLCVKMIDAPVSGGVGGAESGKLTFMVGGSEDALEFLPFLFLSSLTPFLVHFITIIIRKGRGVLEDMGKYIVHCGESGAGSITKLCNNLALAIQMVTSSTSTSFFYHHIPHANIIILIIITIFRCQSQKLCQWERSWGWMWPLCPRFSSCQLNLIHPVNYISSILTLYFDNLSLSWGGVMM